MNKILEEIAAERRAQDKKWGKQDHPSVDPVLISRGALRMAEEYEIPSEHRAKFLCDIAFSNGEGTFAHVMVEEVAEAVGASSEKSRRKELVQVAAVAVAWIEAIDRRAA